MTENFQNKTQNKALKKGKSWITLQVKEDTPKRNKPKTKKDNFLQSFELEICFTYRICQSETFKALATTN